MSIELKPDKAAVAAGVRTGDFVVMTAAYNEQDNIAKTIESMLAQSIRPKRWVIASDGSTDRTDQIIESYAVRHDFIRLLPIRRAPGRSFGSKVAALHQAHKLFDGLTYDFIGNLDADVTIDGNYYEDLIKQFNRVPSLGISGGLVFEETNGVFEGRRSNRIYSVAHAGQLVRRSCFESIGGYAILEYGGEDWHAQISARMKGWTSESVPDLKIYHLRHTGTAGSILRHKFRQGRMDYAFGSDPLFELLKCGERFVESPALVGGISRLCGFFWSWIRRDARPVSLEFVKYLRNEQRQKLSTLFARKADRSIAKSST